MFQLGLLRNVFHTTVHDVCLGQSVQITYTATYQTLEHEYVPIYGIGCPHAAQVGIIDLVPFFESKLKLIAIHGLGYLVLVKRVVSCQPPFDAPFDDGADAVERPRHAVLGALLGYITGQLVFIEYGIHFHIPVLLLHPQLEITDVVSGNGIYTKVEAPLVHDLLMETLVTQYLFQIVAVMLTAFCGKGCLVHVLLYLVR